MKLYNTLNKQVEEVKPLNPPTVTVYTCGPTVYDYPHIGNWFTFVRYDLLVRALMLSGYTPEWVMNITDVGHLVSDADEGEDKLEKGARREGKTAWDVAKFYSDYFAKGLERLNVTAPTYLPKATEHIDEQIELVKKLEAKGFTYTIDDGVYFDTAKFPQYANFAQLDVDEQQAGKRVEFNAQKRNPTDFALWKFSPAGQQRDMEWDSPFVGPDGQTRKGFPGWHLECSAMSMKYLGQTIDVHSGGIDHIPVHHTNEIAQSEAVTGQRFANYWMHTNHITLEGEKISKSLGNVYTLEDIEAKGYSLEVLRLHILESHYRSQSKFSWDSLEAAKNRLTHWRSVAALQWQPVDHPAGPAVETHEQTVESLNWGLRQLGETLANDLDTPSALRMIDEVFNKVESTQVSASSRQLLVSFLQQIDQALGLHLADEPNIAPEIQKLIDERQTARDTKDWARSDELRDQLQAQGIGLRDTAHGAIWYRLA